MIGFANTRQFLASQLCSTGARTVKKRSGQVPTHSTLDHEWIVEPTAQKALEDAHLLDLKAGHSTYTYIAEYHGPSFPLHLSFSLGQDGRAAMRQLQVELQKHAATPSSMLVLGSGEGTRLRLHFPAWIADEVTALRLHAYASHWLALHFPELGVKLASDSDMYRTPLPLLGCPQMLSCSSCRGVAGRMELCSHCCMTGWSVQSGSRMQLLGSWAADGSSLALDMQQWLQHLRIHTAEPPNLTVPDCTPALPLWECKCRTWRNQKDSRCSVCSSLRTGSVRLKWGGVYPQLAAGMQLMPQSEDGWRLPVLQAALGNLLRIVGGCLRHPWEHCTMGPVWKLAPSKFLLPLQGLGSACHPGGAHPHAPMMFTITPHGAELACSAPGCKFSTGKRPIYLPQLFPVAAGAPSSCSTYQFEHGDTRLQWLHKMLHDYHATQSN